MKVVSVETEERGRTLGAVNESGPWDLDGGIAPAGPVGTE